MQNIAEITSVFLCLQRCIQGYSMHFGEWHWMLTSFAFCFVCLFVCLQENSTGQLWLDATHHFGERLCSVNVEECIALQTERDSVQHHFDELKKPCGQLSCPSKCVLYGALPCLQSQWRTQSQCYNHGLLLVEIKPSGLQVSVHTH